MKRPRGDAGAKADDPSVASAHYATGPKGTSTVPSLVGKSPLGDAKPLPWCVFPVIVWAIGNHKKPTIVAITQCSEIPLRHGLNNQMLVGDPETGEIRRFLVGPRECEVTGLTWSADRKTMFAGIQHPGARGGESHFPDGGDTTPRSCVIAITRDDGGVIG